MKKMDNKDILANPSTYITDRGILTVNVDEDPPVVSVHDGITPGGIPIGSGSGGAITGAQLANLIATNPAVQQAIIALATVQIQDAGGSPIGKIFPPSN